MIPPNSHPRPAILRDPRHPVRAIPPRPLGSGWVSTGVYLGRRQEALDAELVAVHMALASLVSRQVQGEDFTTFTDSRAVMARIQSDGQDAGQAITTRIIELAKAFYQQGNAVGPGPQGSRR